MLQGDASHLVDQASVVSMAYPTPQRTKIVVYCSQGQDLEAVMTSQALNLLLSVSVKVTNVEKVTLRLIERVLIGASSLTG